MSWEDVNTHQIPFCTYKQTKWKTKNSLFPVAQTVPRSWCSMLFNVSADFGDIVGCSDEACSSVSQRFILGTLVNQNKTNRRLSLFQMSFPWSLKFTFYYKLYHQEKTNWNVLWFLLKLIFIIKCRKYKATCHPNVCILDTFFEKCSQKVLTSFPTTHL